MPSPNSMPVLTELMFDHVARNAALRGSGADARNRQRFAAHGTAASAATRSPCTDGISVLGTVSNRGRTKILTILCRNAFLSLYCDNGRLSLSNLACDRVLKIHETPRILKEELGTEELLLRKRENSR